jgi:glycosyltransferase involved in cell wall biosynthesis
VLHVIDHTADGGAQVVVHQFIRELRGRFDFAVTVLGRSGRFSGAYEAMGVPVFALGTRGSRWNPLPIVPLVDVIRQNRFDLVHTHLFKANIIGTLAAKWAGVRTILHDHWGVYPETLKYHIPNRVMSRIYIEIYRYVLRLCDRALVLTERDLRFYLKYYAIEASEIAVLPNSVDLNDFNSPAICSSTVREQLGLSPQTRLVVMIARLEVEKDWLTFLQVARQVRAKMGQSCAFLIVGSGSEEQTLRNYANTQNSDDIFFLGYRDDIPLLLREADVFLLTSRFEPFGIVVLEAMAAGCPVVATRSGGPQTILTDEVDGLLGEVGDVYGLSARVLRLLNDEKLGQRLALNARRKVVRYYNVNTISVRMASIYKKTLGITHCDGSADPVGTEPTVGRSSGGMH